VETFVVIGLALLWVVVMFNLMLTLALIRRVNGAGAREGVELGGLPAGQPAPDFTAETTLGEPAGAGALAGQATALVFIGPNCSHCLKTLPLIKELQPQAARAGVRFLLVSDGTPEETRAYVERHQISAPVLVAPRGLNPLLSDYKVDGVPFYYMIDASRTIQAAGIPGDPAWQAITAGWRQGGAPAIQLEPAL